VNAALVALVTDAGEGGGEEAAAGGYHLDIFLRLQ
jgi:hypothetical protein